MYNNKFRLYIRVDNNQDIICNIDAFDRADAVHKFTKTEIYQKKVEGNRFHIVHVVKI